VAFNVHRLFNRYGSHISVEAAAAAAAVVQVCPGALLFWLLRRRCLELE